MLITVVKNSKTQVGKQKPQQKQQKKKETEEQEQVSICLELSQVELHRLHQNMFLVLPSGQEILLNRLMVPG